MSREEKLLLLQLILEDVRGNWGWNLGSRIDSALELAIVLDLKPHISSIKEYLVNCADGDNDGRFFRMNYKYGGYENMEELHGLEPTIMDKSDEFKSEVYVLIYPENRFDDWEEYEDN